MDAGLAGKAALVTGGGTGIGLAIASALADEGVDVAVVSRTEPAGGSGATTREGGPCFLVRD